VGYLPVGPYAHVKYLIINKTRSAYHSFSPLPSWSVFGLVEVHGFGFLKSRSVTLCQRLPFTCPSTMFQSLLDYNRSLPCCRQPWPSRTCAWISITLSKVSSTCWRMELSLWCVAFPAVGFYHSPPLLLLFKSFFFSFFLSFFLFFGQLFFFCYFAACYAFCCFCVLWANVS